MALLDHRDTGDMDSRLRGNDESKNAKPLNVVELGAVIAGPFAGSLMAELGGDGDQGRDAGRRGFATQYGTEEGTAVPIWFGASAREKELRHASI